MLSILRVTFAYVYVLSIIHGKRARCIAKLIDWVEDADDDMAFALWDFVDEGEVENLFDDCDKQKLSTNCTTIHKLPHGMLVQCLGESVQKLACKKNPNAASQKNK